MGTNIVTKGNFVLNPNLTQKIPQSKIVKLATIAYLMDGVDPEVTVKASTKVTDFIMTVNSTDFLVKGERLGYKALRVVYSEFGDEFKALKNDNTKGNGAMKESVVLSEKKLKFLITLSDYTVESLDLNYDRYLYEAWVAIYSIIKPRNDNDGKYYIPKEDTDVNWRHVRGAILGLYKTGIVGKWYDYLTSFGISVIPKNISKRNYVGVRTKQKETWSKIEPKNALGLAIVCDNCCSIDIDNPANLDPALKHLIEKFPTMKIWHGEDKVLNGGKGAFIYKTTTDIKLKSSSKMVDNLGFEFLNDNGKVQTVIGIHPKMEMYQVEGTPVELPHEIKEYLMGCKTPEGRRAIGRITNKSKTVVVDRQLKPNVEQCVKVLDDGGIGVRSAIMKETSLHIIDFDKHWAVISVNQATGQYYINSNHSNWIGGVQSLFEGLVVEVA